MISTDRKNVRKHFAALLNTELVTTTGLAQVVYDYRAGLTTINGQSPVVTVSSLGSQREHLTYQGLIPTYRLQVDVFVLYSDTASGWTDSNAEDRLDDLEEAIARVVGLNKAVSGYWEGLEMPEFSSRMDLTLGGVEYIREMMTILFK